MPDTSTLLVFVGASMALLLLPGPAVMYIITRSATQGTKAGLISVAGIHVGTIVHVIAAVAGLSALIVASATAFTVVKLAGAAYLIILGVMAILPTGRRSSRGGQADPAANTVPMRRVFRDAVVVNVLNPKTAVFFLAFVPQFVDRPAGGTTGQIVVLSMIFIALGLLSDGVYALSAGWVSKRLSHRSSGKSESRAPRVASGLIYIALGLAATRAQATA